MNILLTGCTGLLGRHILFETVRKYCNNSDPLHITILGRSKNSRTGAQRINDMFYDDGYVYLSISDRSRSEFCDQINSICSVVNWQMEYGSGDDATTKKLLQTRTYDLLIHAAAVTNFQDSLGVRELLEKTNVLGTMSLVELLENCAIQQAVIIGSAYSCGIQHGYLLADSSNPHGQFRNPYELSKLKAEKIFLDGFQSRGIPTKAIRVSTVCGRLMEPPFGAVSKFDIPYEFGSYLLYRKLANEISFKSIYSERFDFPVRIPRHPDAGLNMVPADYAAKAILCIADRIQGSGHFHVCADEETPHRKWLDALAKTVNTGPFHYVDDWPTGKVSHEDALFRKTVGKIFMPYIRSAPMIFDLENTKQALASEGLKCPRMDTKNLTTLFNYAKTQYFGLLGKDSTDRLLK